MSCFGIYPIRIYIYIPGPPFDVFFLVSTKNMTQARSGETQPKTRHQSTKTQHQSTTIWHQKYVFQKFLVFDQKQEQPRKKRLIGTPGICWMIMHSSWWPSDTEEVFKWIVYLSHLLSIKTTRVVCCQVLCHLAEKMSSFSWLCQWITFSWKFTVNPVPPMQATPQETRAYKA